MKAWILQQPAPVEERPLRLVDLPVPAPGPGEALIRVTACAICRTDLHVVEGELAMRSSRLIPGHQVVGRVHDVGSNVTGLEVGQRVGLAWLNHTCGKCPFCAGGAENLCGQAEFTGWTRDGGYAEYVAAPADFLYKLPDGFSDVQAAPLLCAGIIGYRALRLAGSSSGQARISVFTVLALRDMSASR